MVRERTEKGLIECCLEGELIGTLHRHVNKIPIKLLLNPGKRLPALTIISRRHYCPPFYLISHQSLVQHSIDNFDKTGNVRPGDIIAGYAITVGRINTGLMD